MRRATQNLVFLMPILLALAFQASSPARAAVSKTKMTKKELHYLIAHAKTAQDHEKLAAYYRAQAEAARAKVAEHKEMAQEYRNNPEMRPHVKGFDPVAQCEDLVRTYGDEAKEFEAMAEYHEKLAKEAGH